MTDEPPGRTGRPPSGAAARLAALLAEFGPDTASATAPTNGPTPDGAASGNGHAVSALRAQVAALAGHALSPDASGADTAEPGLIERVDPEPAAELTDEAPAVEAREDDDPDEDGPDEPTEPVVIGALPVIGAVGAAAAAPTTVPTDEDPVPETRSAGAAKGPWRRRVLPIAMAVLIIAIPVLAVVGTRTVLNSRSGKVTHRNLDPTAAGYIAIVEPTPTALVVQRDAAGAPVSATVLSLGTGDAGGSVLFVPLDTNLLQPALYVDRLRTAYARGGEASLVSVTSRLLGIGFDKVVDLGDADWAQLVGPVSPLKIDNPVAMTLGPTELPQGPIELPSDLVGAYLAANVDGQDDLDRMARQQVVWRAWLQAIAEKGTGEAIPQTTNGIGPFIDRLAAGATSMATLDVVPSAVQAPDGANAFDAQALGVLEQVTDAVPAPVSPGLGGRSSTRVLNGMNGQPIPDELIRALVMGGAQIDALGNATEFGQKETVIEYRSPKLKARAESVREVLGGGKIRLNAATNDPVDIVIVLGRDVLQDFAG